MTVGTGRAPMPAAVRASRSPVRRAGPALELTRSRGWWSSSRLETPRLLRTCGVASMNAPRPVAELCQSPPLALGFLSNAPTRQRPTRSGGYPDTSSGMTGIRSLVFSVTGTRSGRGLLPILNARGEVARRLDRGAEFDSRRPVAMAAQYGTSSWLCAAIFFLFLWHIADYRPESSPSLSPVGTQC